MKRIFNLMVFAASASFGQVSANAPGLKFDRPMVIDTICRNHIDTSKYKFYFPFKNVGKEPVIITRVYSSDPDFACDVPREPILQNKKDSIGVCLVQQQLISNFNKSYKVEYSIGNPSEVYSLQLRLKRVIVADCKKD